MPSGSVIRYDGKRGTVWRLKYVDGSGKQVMETVGAERDGWTERRAREALADRLSDVRRRGHRKPAPLTFGAYVDRWLSETERRRDWRPRRRMAVVGSVDRLRPYFGPLRLAAIRPPDVSTFIRDALDEYAPATVNLDVNVLVDVFNSGMREELMDATRRSWRSGRSCPVATGGSSSPPRSHGSQPRSRTSRRASRSSCSC